VYNMYAHEYIMTDGPCQEVDLPAGLL